MLGKAHKRHKTREDKPYIEKYIIAVSPTVIEGEEDEHYH